ncbi:MAG TPA: winged helix DNA-binding domain-containing protein [Ohtaekwangia sp.]|nr:winged helix DNA-binding domain-containing protein [Ohtaekwangia sp.]
MKSSAISNHRLTHQQLVGTGLKTSQDIIRWMGCLQAQEYASVKWAIGNRVENITDADVEKAFNAGHILRTHVLRPTWHFVLPEDIRWMLRLSAARLKATARSMHRKLGIDEKVLRRSNSLIAKALETEPFLTRGVLQGILQKGKVITDDIRLGLLLFNAEQDEIICSGPRQGKQFTYSLLDKQVTRPKSLPHEEALAEIGRRYFLSRGPATLQDLAWWAGLTSSDAKKSLEMNNGHLASSELSGITYWFSKEMDDGNKLKPQKSVQLLPAFDEYAVAYKDRSAILDPAFAQQAGNGIFKPVVIVDGKIAGIWKGREVKGNMQVRVEGFSTVVKARWKQVTAAAARYADFLGKGDVEVV